MYFVSFVHFTKTLQNKTCDLGKKDLEKWVQVLCRATSWYIKNALSSECDRVQSHAVCSQGLQYLVANRPGALPPATALVTATEHNYCHWSVLDCYFLSYFKNVSCVSMF